MPMGTEGVGQFFGALGGSKALRERAASLGRQDAMREALTNAQIGNTQNEAALKGVKLDALDPATLGAAMAQLGLSQDQSGGAAGLVRAGQNVDQVGNFITSTLKQSALRQARDAYANGNPNGANQALALANGKPVDLTKVEGNVILNPTMTPDSQTLSPNQIGLSIINARNAAAGASTAAAGNSNALADRVRMIAPLQADHTRALTDKARGVKPNIADAILNTLKTTFGVGAAGGNADTGVSQDEADDGMDDVSASVPSSPSIPSAQGAVAGNVPLALPANPAPANPDVAAPQTPQGYATPKSEAEYKALPPGTQYMHPDGTLRIKGAN